MLVHAVVQPVNVVCVQSFQIHHFAIHSRLELPVQIAHISYAARHSRAEVAPRDAQNHSPAARHVFAAVVAHPFHHSYGPRVAHAETLPHHASQIHLPACGPIKNHIARDDVLLCHEACVIARAHDDPPARQTFARVVVGVADEPQGDALRQESSETLPSRAFHGDVYGVFGQAFRPPRSGHPIA